MNFCCCKQPTKRRRRKAANEGAVGAIVNGGFEASDSDSGASDNEEVYGLKPSVRSADKIKTPRTVEKKSSLLNHSFDYRVHYVGNVEGLHHSQENHSDFLNVLDNLVKQKTLSFTQNEEKFVELTLSKDGLKITDLFPPEPKVVLDRYSLLSIIHIMTFDQNGQTMLAIKAGDFGRKTYNCLVFQCISEVQADQIFVTIQNLFDAVCKMRIF